MKVILIIYCLIISQLLPAQVPDYISVKKKSGITVQNFYTGMPIKFNTADGNTYEGPIAAIAKDTVFVTFYQLSKYTSILGNIVTDTVHTETIPFYYKDIKMIFIPPKGGRQNIWNTVGKFMIRGGLVFAILYVVNGAITKDQSFKGKIVPGIGIGVATAAAGYFLYKSTTKNARAKNNYKIEYVNMQ